MMSRAPTSDTTGWFADHADIFAHVSAVMLGEAVPTPCRCGWSRRRRLRAGRSGNRRRIGADGDAAGPAGPRRARGGDGAPRLAAPGQAPRTLPPRAALPNL